MATKKIASIDEYVKLFKNVLARTVGKQEELPKLKYVNKTIMCNTIVKNKSYILFIKVEQDLWLKLIDDPEIKLEELNISNPNNASLSLKASMMDNIENDKWIDVDGTELFNGLIIKIRPENYDYDISINKNLLPVKLKKSEYTDIAYTVFKNGKYNMIAFKKQFNAEIENAGFTVLRLFQVM